MKINLSMRELVSRLSTTLKTAIALSVLTACTANDSVSLTSNMSNTSGVLLESQTKITDGALHFDGKKLNHNTFENPSKSQAYDYFFGRNISAHGDAVKPYKHFVFMTWYKGGKEERNVMLSRFNTKDWDC